MGACSRQADLLDEPDAISGPHIPSLDSGNIPVIDSGVETDAYPACAARPVSGCQGPVDFPCGFKSWADFAARQCQLRTNCSAKGWLQVKLGDDGCVATLGMDQPSDAIVSCLAAELTASRCPCHSLETTYFFGLANSPDAGLCAGGPKG
jgi:hypothetical protein